jgi:hypothetical protein
MEVQRSSETLTVRTICPDHLYVFHTLRIIGHHSLFSISLLVFVMEIRCISCEAGAECLNIVQIIFGFKRINKFIIWRLLCWYINQ